MANTLVERIKAIYAAVEQQRRRDRAPPEAPAVDHISQISDIPAAENLPRPGRVGNYVFNRIGYHVGSLTWSSGQSTRAGGSIWFCTLADRPETFERRRASDAHGRRVSHYPVTTRIGLPCPTSAFAIGWCRNHGGEGV